MAEITIRFDPANPEDVEAVRSFIGKKDTFTNETFFNTKGLGLGEVTEVGRIGFPLADAPSTVAAEPSTSAPGVAEGTSPAPTNGVEVDAAGTPWDERIHSGNRTKTAAGIWTRRRNVPDEVYQRVMQDLHVNALRALSGTAPEVPPAPAPVPPLPVAAVPLPPQPDERPVVAAPSGNPFLALVKRVAGDVKEGKYSNDTVLGLIASLNRPELTNLSDFVAHHDAIPGLLALIDTLE